MRKNVYIILCICMLCLFASCEQKESTAEIINLNNISDNKDKIEYVTSEVRRIDLREIIQEKVLVDPKVTKSITMGYDVNIKYVNPHINSFVKKGDTIIEFDTKDIDREIELKKFMIDLEKRVYSGMQSSGKPIEKIKMQELEIRILEEELAKLENDREGFKVIAETDCYMTAGNPTVGRGYLSGDSVCKLVDATQYILRTRKDEDMAKFDNIKMGDSVTLSLGNDSFKAQVIYMERNSKNKGAIYFEPYTEHLFDYRKFNSIILDASFDSVMINNVVTVHRSAIKLGDKKYVEVLKDGIRRLRYIETGAKGYTEDNQVVIEVVKGLKEGEEVIIGKVAVGEEKE